MKTSVALLAPAIFGLASALIIWPESNETAWESFPPHTPSRIPRGSGSQSEITFWNDFSVPLGDEDTCLAFRSLEWIAYNLIEATSDITPEAAHRVFVRPKKQSGPIVVSAFLDSAAQYLADGFGSSCFVASIYGSQHSRNSRISSRGQTSGASKLSSTSRNATLT
jgi:hypothetical protein